MHVNLVPSIEARRAYRAMTNAPIERELITALIGAAHLAPSCSNNQPWRFVAIDDEPVLSQVKEHLTGGNYWAKTSPAIIAVASRSDLDCLIPDGREYHLFGCGLASMNLMLQATEFGLIAHPIAGFKAAPIKAALGVPEDYTLIALIVLGHPSGDVSVLAEKHQVEEVSPRIRKPLADVLSWNHFASNDPDI